VVAGAACADHGREPQRLGKHRQLIQQRALRFEKAEQVPFRFRWPPKGQRATLPWFDAQIRPLTVEGIAMHALDRVKIYSCVGEHHKFPWKPMPWPGISNKVLFCDPVLGTTIELARLEKGSMFPVHYHPSMQTLFLLSGKVKTDTRTITPGTFDVIPAGEKHGGYLAEEDSIQFKVFSAVPVYFLENGDVYYYKCDGTVEKADKDRFSAQNIIS
jgi:quercetin dioxygenase-like cupin family protein